jgi:hypothetical protein
MSILAQWTVEEGEGDIPLQLFSEFAQVYSAVALKGLARNSQLARHLDKICVQLLGLGFLEKVSQIGSAKLGYRQLQLTYLCFLISLQL